MTQTNNASLRDVKELYLDARQPGAFRRRFNRRVAPPREIPVVDPFADAGFLGGSEPPTGTRRDALPPPASPPASAQIANDKASLGFLLFLVLLAVCGHVLRGCP